jgi:hypothetical protein
MNKGTIIPEYVKKKNGLAKEAVSSRFYCRQVAGNTSMMTV